LPDRLDQLENLALNLETRGYVEESFNELYRQVHSLKGSGGTHGVHVVSSICHPLEDFLATINHKTNLRELGFANIVFSYLDVLRSVVRQINNDHDAVLDVESVLRDLRARSLQPKYCALVVENSSTVIKLISRILQHANVRVVVEGDGYIALGRVLNESFDLLISAHEVRQLNGLALIAAAKLAQPAQRSLKTILLTANRSLQTTQSKADFVLNKDDQLSTRLPAVLKEIFGASG
jgi:chemotaxis protein histidine kinase CheA